MSTAKCSVERSSGKISYNLLPVLSRRPQACAKLVQIVALPIDPHEKGYHRESTRI